MAISRRGLRPQQQSKIDGMCGLYATLNACKYLLGHGETLDGQLFKALCQKIGHRFPLIMFEGTGTDGVRELLGAAQDWVRKTHRRELAWSAPVWRGAIDAPADYFALLRELHGQGDDEARVFIIGLGKPWGHWTVLKRCDRRHAYFFDSWGLHVKTLSAFTFDKEKAGEGKGQKTLIDYHQTFLLRLPRK